MTPSRSRVCVRTIRRVAADVLRFVSSMLRSHAQLAAENLFLRKQLALYLERQVRPRRADDATRLALIALSRLIDWRRLLTVRPGARAPGRPWGPRPYSGGLKRQPGRCTGAALGRCMRI